MRFLISCDSSFQNDKNGLIKDIISGEYSYCDKKLNKLRLEDKENKYENITNLCFSLLKYEEGYREIGFQYLQKVEVSKLDFLDDIIKTVAVIKSLYDNGDFHSAILESKVKYQAVKEYIDKKDKLTDYEKVVFEYYYKNVLELYYLMKDFHTGQLIIEEINETINKKKLVFSVFAIYTELFNGNFSVLIMENAQTISDKLNFGLKYIENNLITLDYKQKISILYDLNSIANKNGNLLLKAAILYYQGITEKEYKNYDAAITYLIESFTIYKKLINNSGYFSSLLQYGTVLYENSDYLNSYIVFKEAYLYYQDKDQDELKADLLNFLGATSRILGDYKEAENDFLESLNFYSKSGNKAKIFELYNNLGAITYLSGSYSGSISYFTKAEAALYLKDETDDRNDFAMLKNNFGNVYKKLGSINNAEAEYIKGLEYSSENSEIKARILVNLSHISFENKDIENALLYLDQGFKISENENIGRLKAEILYNKGRIFADTDNSTDAFTAILSAHELFKKFNDTKNIAQTSYSLGISLINSNEKDKAIIYLEESALAMEKIGETVSGENQKTAFRNEYRYIFGELIKTLISQKQYEKAWYYTEKIKARALLDNLSENSYEITSLIPANLIQRKKSLISLKNSLSQEIINDGDLDSIEIALKNIDKELDALKREIELKTPEAASIESGKICNYEDVKNKIDIDTAILEYIFIDRNLYLFIISNDGIHCETLINERPIFSFSDGNKNTSIQINSEISQFHELLKENYSSVNTIKQYGKSLYTTLINPVYDRIKKYKKWIVIPDGKLFYLPFAALVKNNGRYLIEDDVYITYAHSSAVYLNQKNKAKPVFSKDFLFFALPDDNLFSKFKFDGFLIRDVYQTKDAYFNTDAKESRLKNTDLNQYRVIEFLLHGFQYNDIKHINSPGIVLNMPDIQGYDGILELDDIFNLKMNPEILILTACSSGLGKDITGEGLYGMNQAFFYAGARSVLSTLWNVFVIETDRYALVLNKKLSAGISPYKAVVSAQKELFINTPHPVYWAPFVLFGDGGN